MVLVVYTLPILSVLLESDWEAELFVAVMLARTAIEEVKIAGVNEVDITGVNEVDTTGLIYVVALLPYNGIQEVVRIIFSSAYLLAVQCPY